ncbi:MAG: hypothetical protein K6A38_08060 [Lachnospiraceae bacterium]|nr:hypothetical protein [Lachnospiraceae bacterium]
MKKFLAIIAMLLSIVSSRDGQVKEDVTIKEPAVINYMTVGLLDSQAASYDNKFEIICEGEVPDRILKTVEEYTSLIPEVILENTADNGFVYIIDPSGQNTENHAGMATFPDCTVNGELLHLKDNTTPPGGKIAVMGDTLSRTKMAAIHEVGHAVDFIIAEAYGYSTVFEDEVYMSMEGDPEWQRIFEEENELSGFPDYNRKCALEYFAEVFRYVFEDPSKLDNVPQSKQYMTDLLESFYGITIG